MAGLRAGLARIEGAVTAFERGLIVVLLALMAGAVFLDAIHRLFAAEEGRIARLLVALAPGGLESTARRVLAPALLVVVTFLVSYAALRTRATSRAKESLSAVATPVRLLLAAAAITIALAAATQLFVWAVPSGLVWSQQMALCFMLWVALAGASLGARERAHIAFELAGAIWPPRLRRPVERLARLIAAAFTLFLAVLAAAHAREHYLEWSSSGGTAGIFEGFRVPRWTIFGFLPVPLAVTALRFVAYGVRNVEEPPR
jgi:TRAP-type C4-dicarboxylate transport system permease small subunit